MSRFAYLFASAVALCAPSVSLAAEVPSFGTEIIPLLTKAGCNGGACHGKGSGQNGFRLSLRGFAPEQDYRWITREFSARRIDRSRGHAAATQIGTGCCTGRTMSSSQSLLVMS